MHHQALKFAVEKLGEVYQVHRDSRSQALKLRPENMELVAALQPKQKIPELALEAVAGMAAVLAIITAVLGLAGSSPKQATTIGNQAIQQMPVNTR